jgi:putative DNA methylase
MSPPSPRKKLIEVSIPLEAINRESSREKSIRHGHPSTLHLWWARRPLAACRAVLFAQLVDDPSACPEEFPSVELQKAERDRLHRLIERLVPWEASTNEMILTEARYEIARSVARRRGEILPPLAQMKPQAIIDYLQTNAPPVYDPFSGGGSIPLEAQRLGLKAMGSDLNPVAVLIGKALIEFPPKFAGRKPVNPEVNELHQWKGAQGLADDVRYYGRWMRAEAEKKIGHLYPKVKLKDGKTDATVIPWLWARTVPSPDPRAKGAHVPLASSFVLSAKASKEVIVKPVVDRAKMTWAFEIDDKPSKANIDAAKEGTVDRQGGVCLLTGTPMPFTHIRAEGKAGRMSVRLMAIVAESQRGRVYLPSDEKHLKIAQVPPPDVPELEQDLPNNPRDFKTPNYGMSQWKDLFTPRQLVALTTFSDLAMEAREKVLADAKKHWSGMHAEDTRCLADSGLGPVAYADAVATYLGQGVSKFTAYHCSVGVWRAKEQKTGRAFGRQAIPMVWDYPECNPFAGAGGDWDGLCKDAAKVLSGLGALGEGTLDLMPAQDMRVVGASAISTDPPYYDNVGYADLSDFFYVWLRRTLHKVQPELFRRVLTQKSDELVATPYRHGGVDRAEEFFLAGMKTALSRIVVAIGHPPAAIYYAFKQSEVSEDGVTSAGWATFLQAVVDSGLAVDATWPVRTEQSGALKTNVNALASSIVLVCRRRDTTASTITRADFLRALRREMPGALTEIRRASVGPTDIQQAAIGPGIGIFTRYVQVFNTDGRPMLVKEALKLINQVREEITSHGDAEYDSETRFALDWFAAKGFEKGRSGEAINMTNAVDVSLDGMNAAGFFDASGGSARLLMRDELPDKWEPSAEGSATVWEACQHLIKRLTAEDGGIEAAAALYNRLGALAGPAHALARRLYDICEQKQWATEGYVYNQLHQEWETIEKRATALAEAGSARDLFSR